MTPKTPRIVISNWVHDEVIARLWAIGDVDANRSPVPWSQGELAAARRRRRRLAGVHAGLRRRARC